MSKEGEDVTKKEKEDKEVRSPSKEIVELVDEGMEVLNDLMLRLSNGGKKK